MTVSTTISREQYATDGVTTAFTIHFVFFDDTDVNAIFVDSSGNETTLALDTDFTVSGGDGDSGTLTTAGTLSPLATGGTLTIYRDIPYTQEADFVENDPLPAETLEQVADRDVMRDQQLLDAVGRALIAPPTIPPGFSGVLPTPVADKLIGWNSTGDAMENKDAGDLGVLVKATITDIRNGTDDAEYITADGLASIWQEGGALVSAASIAKPADASLGGFYTQSGNTGTNSYWAGVKGGEAMEIRYTGAPLLGTSGNLLPPGGAAFQVVAGDVIRWRWDASATKWRAVNTPARFAMVTAGTIDGAAIGGTTPAAGAFTTVLGTGFRSMIVTIADDAAFSFTPPQSYGVVFVSPSGAVTGFFTAAFFQCQTGGMASIGTAGSNGDVITSDGTLTGTTGTDGHVSIRAHTDGKVYVENRSGGSRNFTITVLG